MSVVVPYESPFWIREQQFTPIFGVDALIVVLKHLERVDATTVALTRVNKLFHELVYTHMIFPRHEQNIAEHRYDLCHFNIIYYRSVPISMAQLASYAGNEQASRALCSVFQRDHVMKLFDMWLKTACELSSSPSVERFQYLLAEIDRRGWFYITQHHMLLKLAIEEDAFALLDELLVIHRELPRTARDSYSETSLVGMFIMHGQPAHAREIIMKCLYGYPNVLRVVLAEMKRVGCTTRIIIPERGIAETSFGMVHMMTCSKSCIKMVVESHLRGQVELGQLYHDACAYGIMKP
jgi:hypothetical protein